MKARQIDITKEDVRCCDEFLIEEDHINATYELWLDVDKYFGTDINDVDATWINFYTDWYPDGTIKAYYCIDGQETSEYIDWELTEEETEFFRNKMEDYCQYCDDMSLMELWEEYNE
jgi:hypothetical protein